MYGVQNNTDKQSSEYNAWEIIGLAERGAIHEIQNEGISEEPCLRYSDSSKFTTPFSKQAGYSNVCNKSVCSNEQV